MIVLIATAEQKEQLERIYNLSEIQFFEYQNKWVTPSTNLSNPDFESIMGILESLPTIELPTQNSIE